MSDQNLFKQAAQLKLRFPSNKGELLAEHLFDLPLQSRSGFDLDTVAKDINAQLKLVSEESFVQSTSNPQQAKLEIKLALIKEVIADRIADNEAKTKKAANASTVAQLQEVLHNKQAQALEALTPEEIQKRIDALTE